MKHGKQTFEINSSVKVGFLTLVVKSVVKTKVKNGYILTNKDGTKLYFFTPFNGVEVISLEGAWELIEATTEFTQLAELAQTAVQKQQAAINSLFA